jgi:hypothetical protein
MNHEISPCSHHLLDIPAILAKLYPVESLAKATQSSRDSQARNSTAAAAPLKETFHLQYGETSSTAIQHILDYSDELEGKCVAPRERIFTDLGSGSGKVLITAYLYKHSQFDSFLGIELLAELHDFAQEKLAQLKQMISDNEIFSNDGENSISECKHHGCIKYSFSAEDVERKIKLIQGDFLASAGEFWLNSSLVYMCSTVFSQEMMISISKLCERLPLHSLIISTTHKLANITHNSAQTKQSSSNMFQILRQTTEAMSWGATTLIIHRKIHNRKLETVILKAFLRKF